MSDSANERDNLRNAGLKVTAPRLRILEILHESGGRHLAADEIYRMLKDAGDDIGLATVYRVLTQFEAAGLVARHHFSGDHSVFEIDSGGHHDHMVCLVTGRVVEFTNEQIEALQREIAGQHGFELVDHRLVLYVRPRKD